MAPLIGLSLYYGTLLFLNISYELEDGLVTAVVDYQQAVIEYEGRAIYRTDIAISGLGDLVLYMPVFLFQYLFEPMPWRMSSLLDVVALLENVLRAWLIWNVLKYFRVISNKNPMYIEHKLFGHGRLIFFIFLSFLVMESIWSTGTSNWGNAMRHHVPSLGMLLVAGFAYQNVSILRSHTINCREIQILFASLNIPSLITHSSRSARPASDFSCFRSSACGAIIFFVNYISGSRYTPI